LTEIGWKNPTHPIDKMASWSIIVNSSVFKYNNNSMTLHLQFPNIKSMSSFMKLKGRLMNNKSLLTCINVVVDVIFWVVIVEAKNLKLEKLRGCFLKSRHQRGIHSSSSLLWLSFSSWGNVVNPSFRFLTPHSQKTKYKDYYQCSLHRYWAVVVATSLICCYSVVG
jgi:hypothetical protein